MDPNTVSLAARTFRTQLSASLAMPEGNILIGHPKLADTEARKQSAPHLVNLFFFQLEHSGYPADAASADPMYIRAHCLISAFGKDESSATNGVGAGENDLRLIGGVLAALHKKPILEVADGPGNVKASLQIVPESLSLEAINNLWSTQTDVSYRPSVVYELALVPLPLDERRERSPRVRHAEADAYVMTGAPEDWIPEIRFRDGHGKLHRSLDFLPTAAPNNVTIAIGGVVGETVKLRWEVWHPSQGWRADADADVQIDAKAPKDSAGHAIALPGPVVAGQAGQSLLVATRELERPPGTKILLRSDPLLVFFFEPPE